ncbi:SsgA family sporulation/cell division regulator [Streptomyces sp. VRA16 Mangrove soil]|uniref:SsgA family sporulation/cell division regulator n=1 Tax=Streptomyces sp. VRA16 Mangrove soil TaxID=2817434 RepID=UPI001A9EEF7B|nr:SsgA family sporulation/cell division regulator [Streptomyces sp. VRA16 Mangrove soil]MBO1335603.1 SsgA family sporulation/cell division regulator [Streptomyces sp. VRA16 Mangrove soil]
MNGTEHDCPGELAGLAKALTRRDDGWFDPDLVELVFRADDPLVVTVRSTTVPVPGPATWPVSRDLLRAGLGAMSGNGAVRVRPRRVPGADHQVLVDLSGTPLGLQLLLHHRALDTFLARSEHIVPRGGGYPDSVVERGLRELLPGGGRPFGPGPGTT